MMLIIYTNNSIKQYYTMVSNNKACFYI